VCPRVTGREPSGAAASDAERRAARALAGALRARGRTARTPAVWVRTAWWLPVALACALGVAGSVLSVGSPGPGLAVAAAGLLVLLADLMPWAPVRRLTIARATQNVVSPPPERPGERPVTLVLTAATDLRRRGWAARLPGGVRRWAIAALVAVLACALTRLLGVDGAWLGIVQLPPTLVLLVAIVALLDQAGATPQGDDSALRAALATLDALDADPPRRLDVAVVLAGAGDADHGGLRAWLRARRRRGLRPRQLAVVALEPCPEGAPVWWTADGLVVPARLHPQLQAAARAAAAAHPDLGAHPVRGSDATAAAAARAGRWPAIAIGARPPAGESAPDGPEAAAALAVALVRALDADLAGASGTIASDAGDDGDR
jgi:hypothetical protein